MLKHGQTGTKNTNTAIAASQLLPAHTVAELTAMTAAANAGRLVFCSNGAEGLPCLAYSNGANWLRVELGAAVAVD